MILDVPRAELARSCRKICVERERFPEKNFEEEFLRALGEIQAQHGVASVTEEDLWDVAARESERVANAVVLSELLLPKISALLRQRNDSAAHAPSAIPSVSNPGFPVETRSTPKSTSPLGIADLIDGMLSQDRR